MNECTALSAPRNACYSDLRKLHEPPNYSTYNNHVALKETRPLIGGCEVWVLKGYSSSHPVPQKSCRRIMLCRTISLSPPIPVIMTLINLFSSFSFSRLEPSDTIEKLHRIAVAPFQIRNAGIEIDDFYPHDKTATPPIRTCNTLF